ncbi:MAG: SDR family NAD(P)-dependent oxidoreductase [Gammaproteobacteria bacterium]
MTTIENKTVWITGASSGLGKALAVEYAKAGANVCLSARSIEKLQSVNASLAKPGKIFPCDVADNHQLTQTINQLIDQTTQIDLAILNAGTYLPTPLADLNSDDARALFEVNFFSVIRSIELLAPHMKAQRSGHIVVVASVAGDVGLPYAAVYSASKSALNRVCESLYPELAEHGVNISVVNPGFVKTPLTDKNDFPMPFLITAEEAARGIIKGVSNKRFEIRVPFMMGFIMRRLARLPKTLLLAITKKMLRNNDSA